jgi:hypothetical protein
MRRKRLQLNLLPQLFVRDIMWYVCTLVMTSKGLRAARVA